MSKTALKNGWIEVGATIIVCALAPGGILIGIAIILRWLFKGARQWIGIDVSPTGWDSDMIEYPCVFEHKGRRYMLYAGNKFGATGFGLAVLAH